VSTREEGDPSVAIGTERIEAFSDGVFAIAITLLILEVKVPRGGEPGFSLERALLRLWPQYLAYVLSFVVIGIYWANHHYVFKLYLRTDHVFNLLNVLFLLTISFLPLPTAVLGDFALQPTERGTAGTFYALGLLLPAISWTLMWLYASNGERLIDPRLEPAFVRKLTRQYLSSVGLYLLALFAIRVKFEVGITICVTLTLFYLLPPPRPVYRSMAS
jgi:uncharacterized membrane protein